MGTLYIVATPIGNLEDITARALRILGEVDLILAEDTRNSANLLNHYNIKKPMESYHQHTSDARRAKIVETLMQGKSIALITDAGTPGISDPGNELIDFILEMLPDTLIVPIPGPSAITAALSVSGFDVNRFVFLGFMPKKGRKKLIDWVKEEKMAFAFYESPYRIIKVLGDLEETLGDRKILVARELTKMYEELMRGTIKEVIEKLKKEPRVRGEIVVVVEK